MATTTRTPTPVADWDGELGAGRCEAEPKLDGWRAVMVLDGADPHVLSRAGRRLPAARHLAERAAAVLPGLVLDGELYAGSLANTTSAIAGAGCGLVYHVWDALTLEEWRSRDGGNGGSRGTRTLEERRRALEPLAVVKGFVVVKGVPVASADEATAAARAFVARGYEGAVVKRLDAELGQADWRRIKFQETGDFRVVDFVEGRGRLAGSLGAIVVDAAGTHVRVGAGLSDAVRREIWAGRPRYLGRLVEVRHEGRTERGSLRGPVFVRFRPDKDPAACAAG